MEIINDEIKDLLEFIMDSDTLEEIEAQIDEFNVFETLGITKAEIRHSNVLAWLLNPRENHQLDDIFTRNFIKQILYLNKHNLGDEINIFDLSLMDFNDAIVMREWNHIDIVVVSENSRVVIAIENKMESKEHSNQLTRYYNIINKEFAGYRKVFVYLTPEGDNPSDEDNWIIFDYSQVVGLVERILNIRGKNLTNNVKNFLEQYNTILRRYVVGNSELEKICQEIYYKHQKALDLIFQYKPDMQLDLSRIITDTLQTKGLLLDDSNKTNIRFTSSKLDKCIPRVGEGWTKSKRILLFEFENRENKLALKLIIGPGDETTRKKLHNISQSNGGVLNKSNLSLTAQWRTVYKIDFLKKKDYEDTDIEQLKNRIEARLDEFIKEDLVKIEEIFQQYT